MKIAVWKRAVESACESIQMKIQSRETEQRAGKGGVKPEMHRKRQMERAKSLCSIQALSPLCKKVRNCFHTLRREVPFHFTIPRCAQLPVFYGQKRRHRKVGSFQLRQFKILVFQRGHFTIRSRQVGNHTVAVSRRSVKFCRPAFLEHAWQKNS